MRHNFQNLDIWKKSVAVAISLIKSLKDVKPYLWPLRDQIIKSAVSVPSNIAEGSERDFAKDFVRFLKISKGSNAELRTQLIILAGANESFENLKSTFETELIDIASMTEGLIKRVEEKANL